MAGVMQAGYGLTDIGAGAIHLGDGLADIGGKGNADMGRSC